MRKCFSDFLHGYKLFTSNEEISKEDFIKNGLRAIKEKQFGLQLLTNLNFEEVFKEEKSFNAQIVNKSTTRINKKYKKSFLAMHKRSKSDILSNVNQEKYGQIGFISNQRKETPIKNRIIKKNHNSFIQSPFPNDIFRNSKYINFSERIKQVCSPYNKMAGKNTFSFDSKIRNCIILLDLMSNAYKRKNVMQIPSISVNIFSKTQASRFDNCSVIKEIKPIPRNKIKKNINRSNMKGSQNLSLKKINE